MESSHWHLMAFAAVTAAPLGKGPYPTAGTHHLEGLGPEELLWRTARPCRRWVSSPETRCRGYPRQMFPHRFCFASSLCLPQIKLSSSCISRCQSLLKELSFVALLRVSEFVLDQNKGVLHIITAGYQQQPLQWAKSTLPAARSSTSLCA